MDQELKMAGNLDAVRVHADMLDKLANDMSEAGIGLHPTRGHVSHLKGMAAAMRIDHAQNRVPHEWTPGIFSSADNTKLSAAAAATSAAVADAMGVKGADLPPHIAALLRASHVSVPLGGPVSAAELETSGMAPGDRIATKHALAALGRLTA
jgi:hypothetical protein